VYLIDASNLFHRTLYASIYQNSITPSTNKDKLTSNDYKKFFYHLLFTNLAYLKKTFSSKYGEMILCLDSPNNWRKKVYPRYKETRKGVRDNAVLDFKEYYDTVMPELETVLSSIFPFKVIKVDGAEGDDIIACLVQEFHNKDKILVISEDKDMKQILKYPNCSLYKPIDKKFVEISVEDVKHWETFHILLGDRSDNIPSIKEETEFSPDFLKYCESQNIFEREVYKFLQLEISSKLFEDFSTQFPDKKIYKPAYFGEKSVLQFMKEDLEANLDKNVLYRKHFERNKTLISFDEVPQYIKTATLEQYHNVSTTAQPMKIMDFFMENNLQKCLENINDFIVEEKSVCSLDDWC
jgi:hypothetical protein